MKKFQINLKVLIFFFSFSLFFLFGALFFSVNSKAFCSGNWGTWCCEDGNGWRDVGYNMCGSIWPVDIGNQCNYKCWISGSGCNNGCVYFTTGSCPTPYVPPAAKNCGESGCNSAGCTSGNTCNSNVCQINCGSGYTRSGNCSCVPNTVPPKNCGESGCNSASYPYCTSGNICNSDVCQIICGSGYTRSGNCSCVPDYVPPKNCGEYGCNSAGCVAGNSCNSDLCQINCGSGYTRSGNCGCVPVPLACGVAGCNTYGCVAGNTCNANVCQVNCPAGYSRSGNCACVPVPVACGTAGCNTYGCTAGNTCNANVCQINCPAGHTITNNCNCLPPCSTLSATFSKNACSLDISIVGASPYLRNLTLSGLPVTTITPNILYRHTITSAGLKSWTLNWQEIASVGVATPRNCSTTISNNIPAPVCTGSTVTKLTVPSVPIWGDPLTINAQINVLVSYAATQINSILNPVAQTNCSPIDFASSPFTQNCSLLYIPGTPKVYSWDVTYKIAEVSCPSVVSLTCSNSEPIIGTDRAGYLSTENGVSYIGELSGAATNDPAKAINKQPRFSQADNFSTNIFGSLNSLANNHVLACTPGSNAVFCSSKDYLLLGYSDINSNASWYSYLFSSLTTNLKLNKITSGGTNLGSITGFDSTKVNVVTVAGSLEINSSVNLADGICNNSNVFLINGDLNITSDFRVAGLDDACLFIVNGNTIINKSPKAEENCGGATNNTNIANPAYQDYVQAFIITGNFTTVKSSRQLYIKGGVITNTFNGGLNRNANSETCIYPNLPSEVIDYEGARYIKNLRDALSSPTTLSVFENQYKSNIQ